jgi:hypothetical protein
VRYKTIVLGTVILERQSETLAVAIEFHLTSSRVLQP